MTHKIVNLLKFHFLSLYEALNRLVCRVDEGIFPYIQQLFAPKNQELNIFKNGRNSSKNYLLFV